MSESLITILFLLFVGVVLVIDLGIFQKKAHFPSIKEALTWSVVWVSLALLFNIFILYRFGHDMALQFLTGYIVEEALSVDNLFVFIVIFSYFSVPDKLQHRVLFWGILGAMIMRASFILIGAALIERFDWILYIFGVFLIYTGIKLAIHQESNVEPEKNPFVKFCRKFFPVADSYHENHFFVKIGGKTHLTPLFLVLVVIESTDLAFATDSIPAIFAITRDPFIVFTSNIFAILGLRSLYFVLANAMKSFKYLSVGLSIVLAFIGTKMLIEPFFKIHILPSLLVICVVLSASIIASLIVAKKNRS